MTGAFGGQVVVVTGASRGIGLALARHYVDLGATVVGVSRGAGSIEHERYVHRSLDASDAAAVATAVRSIGRAHGRIDALVNNAGAASMNLAVFTPDDTVQRLFDANFRSTVNFSRECVRVMQRRRYGRIVNFSSVAVPLRLEGESIYAAMKSANEAFTRVLAREVGSFGITVNAIGPGPVETDLIRGVPRERIDALVNRLALSRRTTIDDVVYACDLFLRPEAAAMTGQILYLGGAG